MQGFAGTSGPRSNFRALALVALVIAAVVSYSNSFNCEFHFDDFHQFVQNPNMKDPGNIPRFFTSAEMASQMEELRGYRPLTYASYALNHAISGDGVTGYHIVNFLLHLANILLVFLAVGAVFRKSGREDPFYPALFAAAVFALHPVQTGAVTYLSARSALLASLFYLAAFYVYVRHRESGKTCLLAMSAGLYLLGLLSKETAVSLPALILVYELMFAEGGAASRLKGALPRLLPFIAVLAAFLLARRYLLQGFVTGEQFTHTVGEYFISEARVLLLYLRLLLLPVNQNADYDLPVSAAVGLREALGFAAAGLMIVLAYLGRKKYPAPSFFGAWFLVALAPESSLVPITDIAVEYRLYLPLAGFAGFAASSWDILPVRRAFKVSAAAAALALLCALTFARNGVWATEYTLWSDAARKAPYSARTHANLGSALMHRGEYARAVEELTRSLDIDPMYDQSYNVYNNIGYCFYNLGMPEEALGQFQVAVKVFPGYVEGYENMGWMYFELGRYAEAKDALERALLLRPDYEPARLKLEKVRSKMADFFPK